MSTAGVGTFLFGSLQQSAASQSSSSARPRGSLSLESTTNGFLAGYHKELQATMSEEGLSKEYSSSPSNTLLLLQKQLLSFSSNNNASLPVPVADTHGKFMMASAGTTELPTSPGPLSFEDDDPFLLDRLWSQTLKMTMASKNPLVTVRPRSMGYEQQSATMWGGNSVDLGNAALPNNFSSQKPPSNTTTRNTLTMGSTTVPATSSYGGNLPEQHAMVGKDIIAHNYDSRAGPLSSRTMTPTVTGEYQGEERAHYRYYGNNINKGGTMNLFSSSTSSSGGGGSSSEGDSSGHHRRQQQLLLQMEEVNSIPAPSDGSGGGGRKGGIAASSSSSSSERDDEDFF